MKSFQALCTGFDPFMEKPIPSGTLCVIRLDAQGGIQLVSAGERRYDGRGININPYELRTYFKLGHSAQL